MAECERVGWQQWRWLGLLLFLFVSGCSKPVLTELQPADKILAFGDSLTRGVGVPAEQSYPAVLQQLSGIRVINAGVPGELSSEGLKRLPGVLDEIQPNLIILCHGGNDILRKRSMVELKSNLQQMIELAQQRGIEVILISVPKPGLWVDPPELYRELADNNRLPIDETILGELESDRKMKSDMVHLNQQGYRLFAQAIYQLMVQRGALSG
ncbi:arylesterase [Dongshaea marina]|uniref:arylesterase n=1 Tax=Dongshaea marina TaxID=2047966 RepID=UPI000D3EA5D0|nr:arylesterase [Dongshaea marina]